MALSDVDPQLVAKLARPVRLVLLTISLVLSRSYIFNWVFMLWIFVVLFKINNSTLPGRWQLRFGTAGILHVPRTRRPCNRSFAVVFRLLPSVLRLISSTVCY